MIADCTTKLGAEREYLLQVVRENTWSEEVTEAALQTKQRIREARDARAIVVRAMQKILDQRSTEPT